MSLMAASSTLTRFRLVNPATPDTLRQIPQALIKNSFRDIDQTTDERAYGWVCFDNFLDSEWLAAPPEKGEYMAFALRLDTRRIPPAVFRKYLRLALEKEMRDNKASGRSFISKERKVELREQVRLSLMAKTLPIPAVFDVVWNLRENMVYFSSVREKMIDLFMEYFSHSFDLHLEQITPLTLGLADPSLAKTLETAEATDFSARPAL